MDRSEIAGENIDKVISIDVSSRGVIDILYKATKEKTGSSLTLTAARRLFEVLRPVEPVIIITGAVLRAEIDPGIGETDGPPGAAIVARGIKNGFNALPVIFVDSSHVHGMEAVARGAGLNTVGLAEAKKACEDKFLSVATVMGGFPQEDDSARNAAKEIIKELKPTAIITIERVGMNEKGVYHNTRGRTVTAGRSKFDYLIKEARENGIPTIGIGDGGNEIGMGVIKDTLKERIPYGAKCQCPCGGGIAPETETDVLISAAVSNWGAYGLIAALSVLKNQNLLHDGQLEEEMLRNLISVGFVDGMSGQTGYTVDGLSLATHISFLRILNEIVASTISGGASRYYTT